MTYYLAPSLVTLRAEINKAHPNRDKSSDGWIGDTSHAARVSDHNPDYAHGGVVRAIDVDEDGPNMARLLQVCIKDARTHYVIYEGKIYQRKYNFVPKVYTGTNAHTKHMHISILHGATYENSTKAWGYPGVVKKTITEIAREVIAGKWGNGLVRAARLTRAGYNPLKVQLEVRRLLGYRAPVRKTVHQIALEVIDGKWGTGADRVSRLRRAGYDPVAVQKEVNRLV
jgi:hypothetical protein